MENNLPKEIIDAIEKEVDEWMKQPLGGITTRNKYIRFAKFGYQLSLKELESKDREIAELKERVINLQSDNMTHEYNNAEAEKFWPELKRQIIDEAVESEKAKSKKLINGLKKIEQMSDPGSYEKAIVEMKSIATGLIKEYQASSVETTPNHETPRIVEGL